MNLEAYLGKKPKKHLIFDFDNTLVEMVWPNDIHKTLTDYVRSVDEQLLADFGGIGYDTYNQLIKKYGPKVKSDLDAIYLKAEFSRMNDITRVNKTVFDFIKLNQGRYHFYIWSNNQRKSVTTILVSLSYQNLFDKLATASDVSFFKPDIDGFNKLFDSVSQKKSDYLMVGDSENDRQAALNSGIEYFHCSI